MRKEGRQDRKCRARMPWQGGDRLSAAENQASPFISVACTYACLAHKTAAVNQYETYEPLMIHCEMAHKVNDDPRGATIF